MKKILLLQLLFSLFVFSCQKSITVETIDNGEEGDSTIFSAGDSITYEVITKDTGGWFGIWTGANGNVAGTPLENITWGSPLYSKSGWSYSFAWDGYTSQLMMSVFARSFMEDITINLYRNNELITSVTNNPNDTIRGVARIIYNIKGDTMGGTVQQPLLTYEVVIDQMDSTKNQYDAWNGQWYTSEGVNSILQNPLTEVLPIPSGWRYSFKPAKLPFIMSMQAWPFSKYGARATMNFYVNGALVKTSSANDVVYPPMTYNVL